MCADLCLILNLKLYLSFNSESYAVLNRALFEKSFQQLFRKSFALSFGLLFDLKYDELWDLSCLASYRQMPPGGRSLGRPLGGRIVVLLTSDTTYRQPPARFAPTAVRHPHRHLPPGHWFLAALGRVGLRPHQP
jgi:hypothetical protein